MHGIIRLAHLVKRDLVLGLENWDQSEKDDIQDTLSITGSSFLKIV